MRSRKWESAGITAVIYLTNFWEWSGGMMTYLYWTNGGRYIDMNDPAHPWPEFPDMSSEFYGHAAAVRMFDDYVRAVVSRRNTVTGTALSGRSSDPGWQLANEPRPGGSDAAGTRHMKAYLALDRRHRAADQVDRPQSHGIDRQRRNDGLHQREQCVIDAHSSPSIDYVNAHVWPQNWNWADPKDLAGTWPTVEKNTRDYIASRSASRGAWASRW